MVGGVGGVPQSDFRGSQKSRVISGEMSKYDRKRRGKHQRSERTDGTSGETNKYRKFSLCEANMHGKLIYNGDSIPAGGGRQKWCFSVTSAGC